VNIYISCACGLAELEGQYEGIYLVCVWFGGTGSAL